MFPAEAEQLHPVATGRVGARERAAELIGFGGHDLGLGEATLPRRQQRMGLKVEHAEQGLPRRVRGGLMLGGDHAGLVQLPDEDEAIQEPVERTGEPFGVCCGSGPLEQLACRCELTGDCGGDPWR